MTWESPADGYRHSSTSLHLTHHLTPEPVRESQIRMPGKQSDSERNAGTFLALFGLVIIACSLLALIIMVLPQAIGVVLVVGGFIIMAALQYMIWGYWLSNSAPPAHDLTDGHTGPARRGDGIDSSGDDEQS